MDELENFCFLGIILGVALLAALLFAFENQCLEGKKRGDLNYCTTSLLVFAMLIAAFVLGILTRQFILEKNVKEIVKRIRSGVVEIEKVIRSEWGDEAVDAFREGFREGVNRDQRHSNW